MFKIYSKNNLFNSKKHFLIYGERKSYFPQRKFLFDLKKFSLMWTNLFFQIKEHFFELTKLSRIQSSFLPYIKKIFDPKKLLFKIQVLFNLSNQNNAHQFYVKNEIYTMFVRNVYSVPVDNFSFGERKGQAYCLSLNPWQNDGELGSSIINMLWLLFACVFEQIYIIPESCNIARVAANTGTFSYFRWRGNANEHA